MISVVIPAFDVGRVVETCLRSLMAQCHADFECLVIDDASIDDTRAVVGRVIAGDRRFRLLAQDRTLGPSACRNIGLRLATRRYVAFLDADDWLEPVALSRLFDHAERHDLDYCFATHAEFVEAQDRMRHKDSHLRGDLVLSPNAVAAYVMDYVDNPCGFFGLVHCWGRLYRRDIIEVHGLAFDPLLTQMEDVAFNFAYLRHARAVGYVDRPLYVHRIPLRPSLGATKGSERDFDHKLTRAITPLRAYLRATIGLDEAETQARLGHFHASMAIVAILRMSRQFFARPTLGVYRQLRHLVSSGPTRGAIRHYQPGRNESRYLGIAIRWRLTSGTLAICYLKQKLGLTL